MFTFYELRVNNSAKNKVNIIMPLRIKTLDSEL